MPINFDTTRNHLQKFSWLGYPAEEPRIQPGRAIKELVHAVEKD